jgi:hypothetical protein
MTTKGLDRLYFQRDAHSFERARMALKIKDLGGRFLSMNVI